MEGKMCFTVSKRRRHVHKLDENEMKMKMVTKIAGYKEPKGSFSIAIIVCDNTMTWFCNV